MKLPSLAAEPDAGRSRIALFEPAGQKGDTTLAAVLSTVANSVELSLDVLQRYEVTRLPPENPATDLDQVRAYCQKNRIDQAVLGIGSARTGGGYSFRLVVYDRKTDKITTDQQGASTGALDMFDVTDALVSCLRLRSCPPAPARRTPSSRSRVPSKTGRKWEAGEESSPSSTCPARLPRSWGTRGSR